MLRSGENLYRGTTVTVVRKNIRRINISVARDGSVRVSVPTRRATLAEAESFLSENWEWVLKRRAKMLEAGPAPTPEIAPAERLDLAATIAALHSKWAELLGIGDVAWSLRKMKSLWGSCHWRDRHVVYSTALAHFPREVVEYIVVHEMTHFEVHGHGPAFNALLDARLPQWRRLRKALRV